MLYRAGPTNPDPRKDCLRNGYHKFILEKLSEGKWNLTVTEANLF